MQPVRAAIWRTYELLLPAIVRRSRDYLANREPGLSGISQPVKVAALLKLLDERRPNSIVEIGAGENSTPAFSAYASKSGARFVSFEAIPEWRERALEASKPFGKPEVLLSRTEPCERGIRYTADIPSDADFYFVDGPTDAGHIPTMNVPLLLRSGACPKTIVVDGRHPTVDAILAESKPYNLEPDFHYAFVKNRWGDLLPIRHESVFRHNTQQL